MLGDAEEWFYRGLGGIEVNRALPPAQQITLRPAVLPGINWVRTRYLLSLGPIQSDWRRNESLVTYDFTIPANSNAFIEVLANNPQAVTINGKAASVADGVLSLHEDQANLRIEVSSGTYRLVAPAPTTTPSASPMTVFRHHSAHQGRSAPDRLMASRDHSVRAPAAQD